jgi:hypothetical protein
MTRNILVAARLGSILLAALSIAAFWASLPSAMAQIGITQATLSCNDGHNVIFDVDQTALTSLLADVQAINISGTGLLRTNYGHNRPLNRDYQVDGLRLQSFKSSHRSAQLTQINAGDYVGRHNHVPFQVRYLYRAPHHDG